MVCGVVPDEGLWVAVVVLDEVVDGGFEFLGGTVDAAAELAYIEERGYPISYVEMGEEPDGQFMLPEDYAALYLQWATALHKVDPKLKLGGPVFTGVNEDIQVWPDTVGHTSWLGRFVDYLKSHGRMADLTFVSFEHYPLARG